MPHLGFKTGSSFPELLRRNVARLIGRPTHNGGNPAAVFEQPPFILRLKPHAREAGKMQHGPKSIAWVRKIMPRVCRTCCWIDAAENGVESSRKNIWLIGDHVSLPSPEAACFANRSKRRKSHRSASWPHFWRNEPEGPFWRNEPEDEMAAKNPRPSDTCTLASEAVSKKPQLQHRIGANPGDSLTLTIASAKRIHGGESGRRSPNAHRGTSALPRAFGLRRRQRQARVHGRAREDRFGPFAARPRLRKHPPRAIRSGGRKAASPARRSTPCAG